MYVLYCIICMCVKYLNVLNLLNKIDLFVNGIFTRNFLNQCPTHCYVILLPETLLLERTKLNVFSDNKALLHKNKLFIQVTEDKMLIILSSLEIYLTYRKSFIISFGLSEEFVLNVNDTWSLSTRWREWTEIYPKLFTQRFKLSFMQCIDENSCI